MLSETWVVAAISAGASGVMTLVAAAIWFGRNTVTKDDLLKATATTSSEIRDLRGEIDAQSRHFGEAVAAVREKVAEVELFVRDTFVRRDSWHAAMNQMQVSWAASDKAAEERSLRIEAKVDRLIERQNAAA